MIKNETETEVERLGLDIFVLNIQSLI